MEAARRVYPERHIGPLEGQGPYAGPAVVACSDLVCESMGRTWTGSLEENENSMTNLDTLIETWDPQVAQHVCICVPASQRHENCTNTISRFIISFGYHDQLGGITSKIRDSQS